MEKTYMHVEDLDVYQKLCKRHIEVCDLSHDWPQEERYELGSQVRRSSNSSPAQLAEKHDVYFNRDGSGAADDVRLDRGGEAFFSCASDLAVPDCISDDPLFADADGGDYRLQTDSPCVNVGNNEAWMATAVDLDGRPRIIAETVDMGAYECLYPVVSITNGNVAVDWTATHFTLKGTNGNWVVGTMHWMNATTGGTGAVAASPAWSIANIPLAFGANALTVTGTNIHGGAASDSAQIVRGAAPPLVVDITTPETSLIKEVTTVSIVGTNNEWVVGIMTWTNPASGAAGFLPATPGWSIAAIPLAVGTNGITVTGTNVVGILASDQVEVVRADEPTHWIDITTTNMAVYREVTEISVSGTNNVWVVGDLAWANALTGGTGFLPATSEWTVDAVPLGVGTNVITVIATNVLGDRRVPTHVADRYTPERAKYFAMLFLPSRGQMLFKRWQTCSTKLGYLLMGPGS